MCRQKLLPNLTRGHAEAAKNSENSLAPVALPRTPLTELATLSSPAELHDCLRQFATVHKMKSPRLCQECVAEGRDDLYEARFKRKENVLTDGYCSYQLRYV